MYWLFGFIGFVICLPIIVWVIDLIIDWFEKQ